MKKNWTDSQLSMEQNTYLLFVSSEFWKEKRKSVEKFQSRNG